MQNMSTERETPDEWWGSVHVQRMPLSSLYTRCAEQARSELIFKCKPPICGICQRETRPTISEIEMLREAERESWAGRNHSGATSSHKSGRWRETNPKPNSHKYTRRTSSLASIVQQVWLKCHFWMLLLEVQDRVRNWQSVDKEQGSWRIL